MAATASGSPVAPTSQVAPPNINISAAATSRPNAPSTTFSAPTTLTWVSMRLLREQLGFLRQEVPEIRVALDVHEAAHPVMADAAQLQQAISCWPTLFGTNHTGISIPGTASCFTRISNNPKL